MESVSADPRAPRGGVEERRLHEEHVPLARRCAVAVDDPGPPPCQGRRELARVRDRRRAADDDGGRPVVRADPQEPPDDVRDVAAEDAPVHVELVDDDVPELLEQAIPLGVVGEDRRVEHVRVRDDDLARGADDGADGRGRVAVVGRGVDLEVGRGREGAERRDLVLPERLRREQEERAGGRVVGERLQHRHLVAEALAGGRGRHDHDVLTGADRLDRLRLVA